MSKNKVKKSVYELRVEQRNETCVISCSLFLNELALILTIELWVYGINKYISSVFEYAMSTS